MLSIYASNSYTHKQTLKEGDWGNYNVEVASVLVFADLSGAFFICLGGFYSAHHFFDFVGVGAEAFSFFGFLFLVDALFGELFTECLFELVKRDRSYWVAILKLWLNFHFFLNY